MRDQSGLTSILKGHKVVLDVPGSAEAVFGEVVAAKSGALAVTVEAQGSDDMPFAPGMRVAGAVVLPDSRGSFYATVAKVEGNTILLHKLSDLRIEAGCRMFRRRCNLPASYVLVSPSPQREAVDKRVAQRARAKPARCLDLSIGGLALEVTEPVWAGDRLRIQIMLRDSDAPVTVVAEVMWTEDRAAEPGPRRRVGLQFIEVSRADTAKVKAFVSAEIQTGDEVPSDISPPAQEHEPEPAKSPEKKPREKLNSDLLIH